MTPKGNVAALITPARLGGSRLAARAGHPVNLGEVRVGTVELERICAVLAGRPVVIVNRGATRGDELATVKVDGGCSEVLATLADQVAPGLAPH